ncbi:MAG: hypothetical protein RR633_19130 [Acinetobacter sp.]
MSFTGDIKDFRQPLITSLGIMMGFILNFLAGWAIEGTPDNPVLQSLSDWVIVITLLISLIFMLVVVYRLLSNKAYEDAQAMYYMTLKLYMFSICIAFLGIIFALFI